MEFENVYRVESLLVNNDEGEYTNELLASGWKLLAITQYKDEDNSYAKYVLGSAREKIKARSVKKYGW